MPKTINSDLLKALVDKATLNQDGQIATYIPELAHVDKDLTGIAVQQLGQQALSFTNKPLPPITLQSTAKLVPLIGLLEEFGAEQVFEWVAVEPSGDDFSSITRLEQFGPKPSNPMVNAGAIALCSYIPGKGKERFAWLESWIVRLFGTALRVNDRVFASEKRTGDRNRSLAFLLHSRKQLGSAVDETLDLYFTLCSYEAEIEQMLPLAVLLANAGRSIQDRKQIISPETCKITLAIMATCGLYDETGTHMVKTGIPAKSGVSGLTLAVVPNQAGIITLGPLVNAKGNSIRGEIMLEDLSHAMDWHFALPAPTY